MALTDLQRRFVDEYVKLEKVLRMPMFKNGLSPKQKLFIDNYLETFNATESARRAGYNGRENTLAQIGYENLNKPIIKKEIERKIKKAYPDQTSKELRKSVISLLSRGKKVNRKNGVVYLIKEEFGLIKIGKTVNIERRLATLDTQVPYQLKVLLLIESDNIRLIEERLHIRYKDKRIKGEWFALSNQDILDIKQDYGEQSHQETGIVYNGIFEMLERN